MAKKTKSAKKAAKVAKKAAKVAKKAAKKAEKSKTKVDRRSQPGSIDMSDSPNTDFNRAVREAKKQAGEVSDAAQDLHGQAVDSASRTAGSFERALRNTIEKQPFTAVAIALGLAWLFGRMHRPL
jgi:uncharacterized protein involved in exopolysaccharide biosynthesis